MTPDHQSCGKRLYLRTRSRRILDRTLLLVYWVKYATLPDLLVHASKKRMKLRVMRRRKHPWTMLFHSFKKHVKVTTTWCK